jgi:hypothetical protein
LEYAQARASISLTNPDALGFKSPVEFVGNGDLTGLPFEFIDAEAGPLKDALVGVDDAAVLALDKDSSAHLFDGSNQTFAGGVDGPFPIRHGRNE